MCAKAHPAVNLAVRTGVGVLVLRLPSRMGADPRFPAPSSWLEGEITLHTLERLLGEGAHLGDSRALLTVKGREEETVSAPSPYKRWLPEVSISFPGELLCLKRRVSYTNKVI